MVSVFCRNAESVFEYVFSRNVIARSIQPAAYSSRSAFFFSLSGSWGHLPSTSMNDVATMSTSSAASASAG